ncbi:MAG: hypothetical protein WC583_02765 [Candidatus Omnitrophota bacterium]|jgi:hypothetical protein|nr:hypothetical protein [Sphaerochaeta sp.]
MSIGYFADLDDAEDYFDIERLETSAWDDLVEDSATHQKQKVIVNAYNRLYYDPRWDLPTHADASAVELIKLRKANAEMAYYLAQHLDAEDHRKGIQAQGVVSAGVVKETYSEAMLKDLPIPPFVEALLEPWLDTSGYVGVSNIARDDEYSARKKVHDF